MEPQSDVTSAATVALPPSAPHLSHSSIPDEGRFVPGTLLGGRYRIIGLLGKGGMGEVYRATDLTLGQSVALKFLPSSTVLSVALLERFHSEVRVARQVSHPNVCRVYDIGEAEGMPFISMEYVDGEDLATLLLRIGRLPAERAVEIARRICAGLAAAHAKGVIHRDLKPQNIMMNRRGEIMIMDFGLAAIAGQLSGPEVRSGTPAYMAPEQLKGTEVTAKSDIYALGLVLFELFTGKRPFEGDSIQTQIQLQEAAQPPSMTSIAIDIDPTVEKIIRRCLDPDPAKRPANALSVASALPGGDPLAAALAAGETPSPDLVANAGKAEGLALRYSVACLAAVAICLVASSPLRQAKVAFFQTPSEFPPEVLSQKARDIAASFGYDRRPADSVVWLHNRLDLLTYLDKRPQPRDWPRWLASEAPFAATYRESPEPLVADPVGDVDLTRPAPILPGMVSAELDGLGRLRDFQANPYTQNASAVQPVTPESVFRAAQLDFSKFTEVAPQFTPLNIFDQFHAWKGPHPAISNIEITVEIASWKGAITSVKFLWPWTPHPSAAPQPSSPLTAIRNSLGPVLFLTGIGFALFMARRNWKLQRADRRGALRIAIAIFILRMIIWAGTAHVLARDTSLQLLSDSLARSIFAASLFFVLYLALEPALRARWPHSIVTWNRVLTGRWKDPQVASHILVGAAIGVLIWTIDETRQVLSIASLGLDTADGISMLLGTRHWVALLAVRVINSVQSGLIVFFLFFALRLLLRKDWLAALVSAVIFSLLAEDIANSINWQVELLAAFIVFSVLFFVLLKVGLVATISAIFFVDLLGSITLGTDLSAWYAPTGFATIAVMVAITLYAFRQSLGDPKLS